MKAVIFHDIGDILLDNVKEPKIQDSTDAIVRLTASAISGTDLHMVRGTFTGMKSGTILGHEGVGIVEEIGKGVRNISVSEQAGTVRNRSGNAPEERQLGARQCSVAGFGMGGDVAGKGRNAFHYWRLSSNSESLPDWNCHEPQPYHQHGELQPSQIHSQARQHGEKRNNQSFIRSHANGANHRRYRSL